MNQVTPTDASSFRQKFRKVLTFLHIGTMASDEAVVNGFEENIEHTAPAYEHPVVWAYVGKGRYLQVAVNKSITQLYVAKFDTITSKNLASIAARDGHLSVLQWAKKHHVGWNDKVFISACAGGHIPCLDWLIGAGVFPPERLRRACIVATEKGHTNVLRWLADNGYTLDNSCNCAAREGKFEALLWSHANKPMSEAEKGRLFMPACLGGHLTILKWLKEGIDPNSKAFNPLKTMSRLASACNHIHILDWLHEENLPIDMDIARIGADAGRIEAVQWAHAHACTLNEETCYHAAKSNSLDILMFLRSVDCPWDARVIIVAREKGYVEVENYAIANGCPLSGPPPSVANF